MKKSNQEESRQHNRRLVLSMVYANGQISRVDISRRTGLTRTTVSEIVAGYKEDGLIVEAGRSQSSGGKPAILLRVDENARQLIGIDLSEREFRGALVDLRGNLIHRKHVSIEGSDGEDALNLVCHLIGELLKKATKRIVGIGIGTPGLMDYSTGVVRQAINLNWKNLPLGELLAQKYDLPVKVANDCQVAALGEFTFGEIKNSHNMILIKAGNGIGAGMVLDGNIFFGDNAGAGEIGHIRILENGERCRCGNFGCLETVVSSRVMVRAARQLAEDHPQSAINQLVSHPNEITIKTIEAACHHQDVLVRNLVNDVGCVLGSVVAHMVSALNINQIVFGGELSSFGEFLLEPIRHKVKTW